jgi:hypothetical protein
MIDIRTQIIILAEKRVDEWFNAQCNDTFGAFYLYHRIGDFIISKEIPDKRYILSSGERISPNWTKSQAKYNVINVMKNASILPLEVV